MSEVLRVRGTSYKAIVVRRKKEDNLFNTQVKYLAFNFLNSSKRLGDFSVSFVGNQIYFIS